jgi:ADP-heptose:LPS heptosyltransferase
MSKKWKLKLINKFLQLYTKVGGNLKDKRSFNRHIEFSRIVIYSTTALGDLMFNTPAIRAIRERYPAAELTLVSSNKNRMLVEKSEYFSHVVYWGQKVIDILPTIFRIRKAKPQLAVLLHSKQPYDVLSAVLSGCEYIIRDNYDSKPMGMEQWLADYSKPFVGHLIDRKLKLVSVLGCETHNNSMFIPISFTPVPRDLHTVIIGFQMGASEKIRCWPVNRFVELANLLFSDNEKYRIALIGSKKELPLADEFLQLLPSDYASRVVNYIGKSTLPELLSYINNFEFLVTGDTGPLHLAVAMKTKTISLFATANPDSTGPLQDPHLHHIIQVPPQKYQDDELYSQQPLALISAADVLSKIKGGEEQNRGQDQNLAM